MLAPTMCKALWERPWARPSGAMLCPGMSAWGSPPGRHIAVCPLLPRPPCTPGLTLLSTQATERPAKRLATPRAMLTSSLRMSSQRLLRNLNNLSVYVATPGERREGRAGGRCGTYGRGWGHRWTGRLLHAERLGSCDPSPGDTQGFSVERRDSEAYENGQPSPQELGRSCAHSCVLSGPSTRGLGAWS